jgi:hypothetical protein
LDESEEVYALAEEAVIVQAKGCQLSGVGFEAALDRTRYLRIQIDTTRQKHSLTNPESTYAPAVQA